MADKVLVTGGLGYVGGRVSAYLAENTDFHVSIGTRRRDVVRPDWLQSGELVTMDLGSKETLENACSEARIVVHLAAMNEMDSARDPEAALMVNGQGTLRLLQAAKQAGAERFIYFSTAHVYGAPLKGVITEETLSRPVHPYTITHKTAEDFVLAEHDLKNLVGIVVRLSNGFGAPVDVSVDRWTLIVNDLCRQAVTTGKLVLRTSGLQKRDFIPLTDVCRAVVHFVGLPREQCGDGLFNLGGECCIQVFEMAEIIAERCFHLLGVRPEIKRPVPCAHEISDPLDYCTDKIRSTGFNPEGKLDREIDSALLFSQKAFGCTNPMPTL